MKVIRHFFPLLCPKEWSTTGQPAPDQAGGLLLATTHKKTQNSQFLVIIIQKKGKKQSFCVPIRILSYLLFSFWQRKKIQNQSLHLKYNNRLVLYLP